MVLPALVQQRGPGDLCNCLGIKRLPESALAFVLPFSLDKNEFYPCQRWVGNYKSPADEEAQKGHGILGLRASTFQGDS